jgi:orotidine-5'-phosphate decarboxylase
VTPPRHFADRLAEAVLAKNSRICVGCDPDPAYLPPALAAGRDAVAAVERFGLDLLDAVAKFTPAVKFQSAFYERFGAAGVAVLERHLAAARGRGLIAIADVKRGDVGHTCRAYADAYLAAGAPLEADAVTVTPYLGADTLAPFADAAAKYGKGFFVVVRSSNPSAADCQEVVTADGRPLYERVARMTVAAGADNVGECGYAAAGAVVGATSPAAVAALRKLMPRQIFLIPGVGAQGGEPALLGPAFDERGLGGLVAASRSVAFAWRERGDGDWAAAAADAARELRDAVNVLGPFGC